MLFNIKNGRTIHLVLTLHFLYLSLSTNTTMNIPKLCWEGSVPNILHPVYRTNLFLFIDLQLIICILVDIVPADVNLCFCFDTCYTDMYCIKEASGRAY